MKSRRLCRNGILLAALILSLPANAKADDWPQFRGPKRDDISNDKGLLKTWPKDGPPLAWKCEGVGIGYSSLSVVGKQAFTMGDLKDGCYLIAIDRENGTILWKTKVGETGGNYPAHAALPPSMANRSSASANSATSSASTSRTAPNAGGRTSRPISRVRKGIGTTPSRRSSMAKNSSSRPVVPWPPCSH